MMNESKRIAAEVLEKVGGKENVAAVMHCITRLRFTLKNPSLFKEQEIKAIKGVLGLQIQSGQYQVIIGPKVDEVYAALCGLGGFKELEAVDEDLDRPVEKLTLKKIGGGMINGIVSCMIPTLPILFGGGMLKVTAMLLVYFHILPENSSTYLVLYAMGQACFYFLPVFIGIFAAEKFHASVPMAAVVCTFLVFPDFAAGLSNGTIISVFGLPITKAAYANTVLPSIMIVWALAKVEKGLKRVIPIVLRTVLLPTITLLIMIPVAIVVIGPLGVIFSKYMADFLMLLYDKLGFVGMGIMGAIRPLLIFTGMHTALIPLAINSFAELGYEQFFYITGMGYVFGSAFACLAVAIRSKSPENKSAAWTCAMTALVGGITEPSLYGVLIRFKRPLISVMCGGFASGCWFGFTKTCVYVMPGNTGIFGIPSLVGPTGANMRNALIGLAISCTVSVVLTLLLGFDENAEESRMKFSDAFDLKK